MLEDIEQIKLLASILETCSSVKKYDEPEEPQGWTIAHALAHIESSFKAIFETQVPTLMKNSNPSNDQVFDKLHDIGEELRHILYHINDMRFFAYLNESRQPANNQTPKGIEP